ncbi:MAG: ATP-binding cassette domain-containing protein [Acidobacteriaceae bacterium]|nr:ATP-binding cassette domain-containing protein [Acidobacteriaceae bacterium]
MAARAVEFANVSFAAPGGHRILHDISLQIAPGETVALLGRSGSGKTTLLRTVNALVRADGGRVLVGGHDVASEELITLRRGIGYVIQESGLFPHMTIARNVGIALELSGISAVEAQPRVTASLHSVGLAAEFAERYPWQLSGGQRQRAGVARALITQPDVLLMDEPFGALDPLTRAEMQTMLRDLLHRAGTTTLIVTHDLEEALFLADRVVLLEQGSIVADVRSAAVRTSANAALQAYVEAATPGGTR